ncbi:MAG: diguanylate cyclase, partial [Oscillospiraceae bacterium]|nr:diguanylate cyclase [Oscillospiraceae bacterium]
MNIIDYSSENYKRLIEMMAQDEGCVHFLWCCSEEKVLPIGDIFIPQGFSDPLDYLRGSGLIDNSSMGAFNVFCAQIEEAVFSGSAANNSDIELQMKLPKDEQPAMYHLFALFLKNGDKVTDIHFCLRPCSEKEIYAKQVVDLFSSDKNPKFFEQRIRNMLARNKDKRIAFVQFDVERFKLINENLGSETGDELLRFFNDSLGLICGSEQPFCRLTADVFMIVTPFEESAELVSFVHMLESRLSDYNGIEYRLVFGITTTENTENMNTRQMGDHTTLARQSIKGNALENIAFYNG